MDTTQRNASISPRNQVSEAIEPYVHCNFSIFAYIFILVYMNPGADYSTRTGRSDFRNCIRTTSLGKGHPPLDNTYGRTPMSSEREGMKQVRLIEGIKKDVQAICRLCDVNKDGQPDLILEEGETTTLSAEYERFKAVYREIRPKNLEEVRQAIGVPRELVEQSKTSSCVCADADKGRLVTAEDLDSDDEEVRGAALRTAHQLTRDMVMKGLPIASHRNSLLDRYITAINPRILLAVMGDVVVNNGATLNISKNTHALYANRIKLYGSGRIVCDGPKTFRCISFQGKLPTPVFQPANTLTAARRVIP